MIAYVIQEVFIKSSENMPPFFCSRISAVKPETSEIVGVKGTALDAMSSEADFSQTISAAVWAFELLYRGGRGRGPKTGGWEAAGGGGGDGRTHARTDGGVRGYYYNE